MSKRTHLLIEIGLGVVLTGVIAWSFTVRAPVTETISFKTYDLFSSFRTIQPNTGDIAIIEIDDKSVDAIGRWPWPRATQAQLIDSVVELGPKVIGLNILYAEADQSTGLEEMAELQEKYDQLLNAHRRIFRRRGISINDFEAFSSDIQDAMIVLNGDAALTQAVEEAGTIVLPMYFRPGVSLGTPEALPDFFAGASIPLESSPSLPNAMAAFTPLESVGNAALATGHSNLSPDPDGGLRRIAPLMQYGDEAYPSFGLQVVREYLNMHKNVYSVRDDGAVVMNKAIVPFDEEGQTYIDFAGPVGTFQSYSALDVLMGSVAAGALNRKIVLVGVTATGGADTFTGLGGERYTGLEIWSHHIENILSQRFIVRPSWSRLAEWGSILLAALVVILVLPLLKARVSIPASAALFVAFLAGSGFLSVKKGVWVSPAYGTLLLLAGFAILVSRRLLFTERGKERVEAEGMETNKMLGLSFQGQGMLDLAFEKFRKCPVDNSMKELLYNLGLDMERKRMFAKAAAVFEHISTADPAYKDITQKIDLLKKASEGAVFGSVGKKGSDTTVVVEGLGQSTTLGRYEVMKELGRGAMGIVYLGKDPKINRQVAIKTLRFDDDMDEEQTRSIKDRFFREAESAGNLTHPNIVRIFDAGEDQDVAYIAMELLDGFDLKKHTEKPHLLPLPRVLDIVSRIADALDYAHTQGVVHRDIKPANIMLLKDGSLRITDFGIARIQATSKTATGAVLGTPAYMSPEQVSGKKVDGQADIFSLGVTLFELLTGEKPFHAESIAALLYRIANVEHPDPREFNPDVPVEVVSILNRALHKDPAERFRTGKEMADALRSAQSALNGTEIISPPPPSTPSLAETLEPALTAPPEPMPEETPEPPETSPLEKDFMAELAETFKGLEDASAQNAAPDKTVVEESPAPVIEQTSLSNIIINADSMPTMSGLEGNALTDPSIPDEAADKPEPKNTKSEL